MPDQKENRRKQLIASELLRDCDSPLILTATLAPVAGLDRFQPAGFPEVGHVIYRAPRADATDENVCIMDSAASMANHLESVCMRGPHDVDLVDDLKGMPYVRCVTGDVGDNGELTDREVIVTSLTEGHRIASTYFLAGKRLQNGKLADHPFEDALAEEIGIVLKGSKKAHPPAAKWWDVFKTIFKYDPNALVHGVLFPQWQIKVPRLLTAHLEAFGAARVDRSGVKFDRLGKTTSGQPIFAVDDATAREIRATFVLDLAQLRSFGRKDGEKTLGLGEEQKEFLLALALWKIRTLLEAPFRFRSGCHLRCVSLKSGEDEVDISVDMSPAVSRAAFRKGSDESQVTDIYWPREELYREADENPKAPANGQDEANPGEDGNESE